MAEFKISADGYFSSFSGADIIAAIRLPGCLPYVLASLSDITLATNRQAFEVLTLGKTCAKGFTSAPRVVAGQLVFHMFDHHLLQELSANMLTYGENSDINSITADKEIRNTFISMYDDHEDELPLFDIIINFCNSESNPAHCIIYGVKLVDSNWAFGVNHPLSNIVYSYVAINFKPITRGFFSNGKLDKTTYTDDASEIVISGVEYNNSGDATETLTDANKSADTKEKAVSSVTTGNNAKKIMPNTYNPKLTMANVWGNINIASNSIGVMSKTAGIWGNTHDLTDGMNPTTVKEAQRIKSAGQNVFGSNWTLVMGILKSANLNKQR